MKLPEELKRYSEGDFLSESVRMPLVEAIVRDCAKVCSQIDDLGEWGESAAACGRSILARYGLEAK